MTRPDFTLALLYSWTRCTPGATSHARSALRHTLIARGVPGEVVSDVVLAVSELVSNAVEHATGPYELWLSATAAELLCEVHDRDPQHLPARPALHALPVEVPPIPNSEQRGEGLEDLCEMLSERGRGLRIVDHLTSGCWGFRLPGNGKKVAWLAVKV